jgi:hypothetical protein
MSQIENKDQHIICPVCKNGKQLKLSYYNGSHKKTAQHIKALAGKAVVYKNDSDNREILRNNSRNHYKKIKDLDPIAKKLSESFRKYNQRLVKSGNTKISLDEYKLRTGKNVQPNDQNQPNQPSRSNNKPLDLAVLQIRALLEQGLSKNKGSAVPLLDKSLIKAVEQQVNAIEKAKNCDDFKQQMIENNKGIKNAPSKSSTDQYVDKIKALFNKMFKNKFDCTDYSFLKDSNKVIDFIENKYTKSSKKEPNPVQISFQTKKAIYTAIVTILKNLGWKDVLSPYEKRQLFFSNKSEARKGLAQLEGDQKKNYVDYNVLQKAYVSKYSLLKSREDQIIADLYVLLPSRRLDWRTLEIVTKTPSNEGNYLLCTTKGKALIPQSFVFNKQKNKLKNTETWGFDNTVFGDNGPIIQSKLQSYLSATKKKDGDLLFHQQQNKKRLMTSSAFGDKVRSIMLRLTGKEFSSQLLRISFENWFQAKNPTYPQRLLMSKWSNHSVETALSYAKT